MWVVKQHYSFSTHLFTVQGCGWLESSGSSGSMVGQDALPSWGTSCPHYWDNLDTSVYPLYIFWMWEEARVPRGKPTGAWRERTSSTQTVALPGFNFFLISTSQWNDVEGNDVIRESVVPVCYYWFWLLALPWSVCFPVSPLLFFLKIFIKI